LDRRLATRPRHLTEPKNHSQNNNPGNWIKPPGWFFRILLDVKVPGTTESGEEVEYEAHVTFAPSSIRLYAPPVPVVQIQHHMNEHHIDKNIVKSARVYAKLDWNIYACILKEVVSRGTFITAP